LTQIIQYAVLGIGISAVYAMLAQGLVLIYRGSGVVNFAQGAFAMVGAYLFGQLRTDGVGTGLSLLIVITVGLGIGIAMQLVIMRPLRNAAPLARIAATLGVFTAIQAGAALHYGDSLVLVGKVLPGSVSVIHTIIVQWDRIVLYGIAAGITVALAVYQRSTRIGLATSAAAEKERAAAALGWSPNLLAAISWAIGGALATTAGALVSPLTGILAGSMPLLVVPALAAALLGRFRSFGLTLLGATVIGVAQSEVFGHWTQIGAADAVPFVVIIIALVVTGQALPLRSHIFERLPSVGSGLLRPLPIALLLIVGIPLMLSVFPVNWQDAFTISFSASIVLLSVVVITGFAGQISLAQYTMAGLGAFVAGKLVATQGWPFWAALLAGVAASVPFGLVFAIPALRTRGVNLAVVTLGLGTAVNVMLFRNTNYTGGLDGTNIGDTKLFGIDINAITHPGRYGVFTLILFAVTALAVANLRRSAAGRRLIAIRANERAAASLGISVTGAKLYAFAVASAIAGLAGVLIGFRSTAIIFPAFDPFQSIYAVVFSIIGGVGYIIGAFMGSTFTSGGIGSLFSALIPGIDNYLALIGGIVVIVVLILNPDGMVPATIAQLRWVGRKVHMPAFVRKAWDWGTPTLVPQPAVGRDHPRVEPKRLEIEGLTVRFGAVVAVDGISFHVDPGEIVGLIGPNGAGKTTIVDSVTGFVRSEAGAVRVDTEDITKTAVHTRVRKGLGRSWQSLELFDDVTVFENLQIASDRPKWRANLEAFVHPGRPTVTPTVAAVVEEFKLGDDLGQLPPDLSYGRQRLVGIARSVALEPSILLLDEPAAGLNTRESTELAVLLRRLAEQWGMAILLIEHDVELVLSLCDRIVVLDFGKKIAEGTPVEIRSNPAVIASYLGSQDEPVGAEAS
jgi:ABC-type branched-subunit amino acid transport system ATPase component/ABC-type branched-subunit amino acid transport system permease subunit